jgi:hypothetical protein
VSIPSRRKHTIGGAIGRPRDRSVRNEPVESAGDRFSLLGHL